MKPPAQKPFLKWAGGKFKQRDDIAAAVPAGKRLIEPFVGAGSVFMNLPSFSDYLLADINPDLINLYQQLGVVPDEIHKTAEYLIRQCTTEDIYNQLRDEFNKDDISPPRKAALFLAINRTCFNGLTRYNQNGGFNVSWNKKPGDAYFPGDELESYRALPGNKQFICAHFKDTIRRAGAGDVVFCDPPYEPMPDTAGFVQYAASGFDYSEQEELATSCAAAHQRGARVVITNSDSPKIKALYQEYGFDVRPLKASRSISCKGDSRGRVKDIIAIL